MGKQSDLVNKSLLSLERMGRGEVLLKGNIRKVERLVRPSSWKTFNAILKNLHFIKAA